MKALLPTIALTAATALGFAAAPAVAGSATYLNGNGGLATSHAIAGDGVTITATATSYNPHDGSTHDAYVGQYSHGLGVTNNVTLKETKWGSRYNVGDGSHTVDGKGWDDTVWLSFDKEFEVTGAIFTYVADKYEDVRVIDADGIILGDYNLSGISDCGVACLDLSDLGFTGKKIGFTAYGDGDSWKLAGVKGTAVPTPSAAAAGLLGLAAVAGRRRKTKVVAE